VELLDQRKSTGASGYEAEQEEEFLRLSVKG
jgi:hypothetical protein